MIGNTDKIVVAGGGGLLGCKIVVAILQSGGQVIATDINLDAMKHRFKENGVDLDDLNLVIEYLDINNESENKLFFENKKDITGVVNATYPRNKAYGAHFFDVSLADFNDNVSLHLGSTFSFSQQCASYFNKHQTKLSLVNISSVYGVITPKFDIYDNTPMTMPVEYAAIKSAIIHLNKYIAAYVNNSLFRVNSVSPGGIFDEQPKAFLDKYKDHTFGKGMLDIDDVTGTVLFLLSKHSKYINGQNIIVDDGFTT
jgi:NAD(P)-dependent dehydrogenase (short-subunit alcohol dehydrogenase family)